MEKDNTQKQIQVQTSPDHKPGFSNSAQINVTNDAVVLQFLFMRPNTPHASLVSEVVLTPQHAMNFQRSLDETLKKHFTKHLEK